MTNEVSPIMVTAKEKTTKEMTLINVLNLFRRSPRLVFVTIKPNQKGLKPRMYSVGKWSDHLRKVSDTFLIVRELTGGPHFHALVSLKPEKAIKVVKHVHFNIQTVGSCTIGAGESHTDKVVTMMETAGELCDTVEECDAMFASMMLADKAKSKRVTQYLQVKKSDNISRILNYMLKDSPTKQFTDYIMINNATARAICECASAIASAPRGASASDSATHHDTTDS